MSKKPVAPYSPEELAELREIHYALVGKHVFNYRPGGAIWQRLHGAVADLPLDPVLRMVEDAYRDQLHRTKSELDDLLSQLGMLLAVAIRDNDADYFRRLAVVLDTRKEGLKIASLTRKELLLPPKRGRAKMPRDLSRAFPVALIKVTGNRFEVHAFPGEFTLARVTRSELKRQLVDDGATISEQELSRWLSRFNFGRFMAEQPIARKPRKTG